MIFRSNSDKFNVEFPKDVKELLNKIDDDVKKQREQWEIYENFNNELDKISDEEWTVYRRRPYILTDHLTKWQNLAKSASSLVTDRILAQIEKYHSVIPALQCLQSDSLTEKHWTKFFILINRPPKPSHEITLKEVLSSSDSILQNFTEIQVFQIPYTNNILIHQFIVDSRFLFYLLLSIEFSSSSSIRTNCTTSIN